MKRTIRNLLVRLSIAVLPRRMQPFALWQLGLPPIAGASPDDPAGGGGNGGNGGGEGGSGGGSGGEGGAGGEGGSGGGEGGSGGDAGWTPPSKAEWDNIQRQQRETAANLKKLQDADAERQRKADEDAGNHAAIAQREKEAREAAERERDEARQEAAKLARTQRVERIAGRLKFRDPSDVIHRLSDDVLDDDSKVERALKDVAKSKPYLVIDGETPKQGDVTGDGGEGGTSSQVSGTSRLAKAYGSAES